MIDRCTRWDAAVEVTDKFAETLHKHNNLPYHHCTNHRQVTSLHHPHPTEDSLTLLKGMSLPHNLPGGLGPSSYPRPSAGGHLGWSTRSPIPHTLQSSLKFMGLTTITEPSFTDVYKFYIFALAHQNKIPLRNLKSIYVPTLLYY